MGLGKQQHQVSLSGKIVLVLYVEKLKKSPLTLTLFFKDSHFQTD